MKKIALSLVLLLLPLIPLICCAADLASVNGIADASMNAVDGLTWGTSAGNATSIDGITAAAAASCADSTCTGFLVCQNSESCTNGSGDCAALVTAKTVTLDNSEVWTTLIGTNGTITSLDTTATVLRGTKEIKIYAGDSGQTTSFRTTFSATAVLYGHFRFKTPAVATNGYVLSLSDGSERANIQVNGSKLRGCHGTTCVNATTTTIVNDTRYDIWWYYKAAASGDGILTLKIATTGTEPGEAEVSVTTGTSTQSLSQIRLQANAQRTNYYDQILVKAASIGAVCD